MFKYFSLGLFLLSLVAEAKFDRVSFKPAELIFAREGITNQCTEQSFINLKSYLVKLIDEHTRAAKDEAIDEKEHDKHKDYAKFLKNGLDLVEKNENLSCSDYLKNESYTRARAIIYSVFTAENPISEMNISDWLGMVGNTVITIPYKDPEDRVKKLDLADAIKEANNLIDPKTNKVVTPNALTKLNYIQVAKLDIGKNHPMWRDEEERQKVEWAKGGAWKRLEDTINKASTKKFSKKCKDNCDKLIPEYDLNKARKVLIFDKIKTSATSPKIDSKDLYGYNWKIKWGIEAFVEPVVSRLYMKLGGRFTDLTYSNAHGAGELLLILGSMQEKSSCNNPNNYDWFVYCMKISKYKFDPNLYVYQRGVIDEKNIDAVFAGANSIIKDPSIKSKYLGRTWVTFKESMVEYSAENVLTKAGSGPENRMGFENDRVLRGLSLFASWVGNDDAKEDNSRSVLFNEDGKEVYAHYWHDLGSSLGSTLYAGKINSLKTDTDFMYWARSLYKNSPKLLLPYEFIGYTWIVVPRLHLYKPDSWNKVTYSDGLWMAMKIASLMKEDIEEAVAASNLPTFIQDALVFKLMDRRIRMAKMFGVIFPGPQDSYPVTIKYNLTKKSVREAIARKFDINIDRIEWEINKHKLLKGNKEYFDTVVKDGQIVSCSDSLLVNIVEKAWYPSGLERRRSRLNYKDQLDDCKFDP